MGDGVGEIVLVRHGETAWSASGRHTSSTDVALTARGLAQGAALGAVVARWTFTVVWTSPRRRAADTCAAVGLRPAAVVDPDLTEWDYGSVEGRTTAEVRASRAEPGWTVWGGPLPGGESVEDVGERADRVIDRLGDVEGHVALFSHGHFLRVLAARWIGLPAVAGRHLVLDTGTISVLGAERETRALRLWNGVPPPVPPPASASASVPPPPPAG